MNLLSVRYIGLRKPGRKFNCIVVGIQFRSRFTSYLYLIWIEIPCSLERYYNVDLYSTPRCCILEVSLIIIICKKLLNTLHGFQSQEMFLGTWKFLLCCGQWMKAHFFVNLNKERKKKEPSILCMLYQQMNRTYALKLQLVQQVWFHSDSIVLEIQAINYQSFTDYILSISLRRT